MAVIERRPYTSRFEEDSDIAFLIDLNHKCLVATVFTGATLLTGLTVYAIDKPIVRLGTQCAIFFGSLASIYKITSTTFST